MNGAHDLGGMHGFGPINPEANEPVFHDDWERRAFALTLAVGSRGHWNLDQSRFARESSDPAVYLNTSYYEHWLHGLELALLQQNIINRQEFQERLKSKTEAPAKPQPFDDRVLRQDKVAKTLGRGGTARMEPTTPAVFTEGDRVLARNINPAGHTRIPRYVRGRTGIVTRACGTFVFPDSHAATGERVSSHLYTVRFEAQELWGPDAPHTNDCVYLDMFEPYLEKIA